MKKSKAIQLIREWLITYTDSALHEDAIELFELLEKENIVSPPSTWYNYIDGFVERKPGDLYYIDGEYVNEWEPE